MGKHIFTKLVHLENKSDGVHKEMGTVGLLGGKVSENCFSRAQARENSNSFPGSF